MTRSLLALALWAALAPAAQAAGVGYSLPKLRMLSLDNATAWGASVQVVGGAFSVGRARLDLALDYAYARDFANAGNESFFDASAGVGLPLSFTPTFYAVPAVDAHFLGFVASPQPVGAFVPGVGPRLTLGYRPDSRLSLEAGLCYAFLFSNVGGRLATLELGGTYVF